VLAPFILLAIILFKQAGKFSELLQKIRQNPPLVLLIALLAFIQGFQLWLFLWAPNNGQAIEVSIGYLLLPIVAGALGKKVFKERFTTLKWLGRVLKYLVNGHFFMGNFSGRGWLPYLYYFASLFPNQQSCDFFCRIAFYYAFCSLFCYANECRRNGRAKSVSVLFSRVVWHCKWCCIYSLYCFK